MTTPTSFGKFGMTLAFAERTLSEVLSRHLAERDILPETWYALKLLATRGPSMSREALSADLAGSRALNADSARELPARLVADGLVHGDAQIELTGRGRLLFADLSEYVSRATAELLGQFDADDIDT